MRLLLVLLLSVTAAVPAGGVQPRSARVLFIGNSLTYMNDLPAMIEAIAASAGLKGRIICRAVAKPDYGLREHWDDGDALRAIRAGGWTHVVLQQGPSSLPDSRAVLREFVKKFAFEARASGAKIVVFGVWPARDPLRFQDAVTESHRLAADDVKGELVAAGEGWRSAWQLDAALPLYASDQFHPSPMGSYLAALMFFQHFTGRSAIGLPMPDAKVKAFKDLKISAAQLDVLQQSAAGAAPVAR
jgi:hypothetical protein